MPRRPSSAGEPAVDLGLLAGLRRIGIAVSGGPDSMALFTLVDRWTRTLADPPSLVVLTVDHGLRAEAAVEADAVVAHARALGHVAEKLVWRHDGPPPSSGIQAAARTARYRLLAEAARRLALDAVLLAHTLDDQAETLLINLGRGSGVAGLAAMPERRLIDGVPFLRPLLSSRKADLVAFLAAAGIGYVTDPSNAADRYTRVRLRKAMPALADLGLTADRLAGTARRMARAEAALRTLTDELAAGAAIDHGGVWSVDRAQLLAAPDEIGLRLLARLIRAVRPDEHPPRAEPLEAWHAALRAGTAPSRATMAGVTLALRRDRLWLYAEAGRAGFAEVDVAGEDEIIWDARLVVTVSGGGAMRFVVGPAAPGDGRRMPKAAAASLPELRAGDGGQLPDGVRLTIRPLSETGSDEG